MISLASIVVDITYPLFGWLIESLHKTVDSFYGTATLVGAKSLYSHSFPD